MFLLGTRMFILFFLGVQSLQVLTMNLITETNLQISEISLVRENILILDLTGISKAKADKKD